ncbi:MAG: carbohydrate binding family 9 domain-containing protein, partial [Rhizobacter sp.]|nr:carbohydrate binding family 9 domain-containing protein [Chlorobiales bacterium]
MVISANRRAAAQDVFPPPDERAIVRAVKIMRSPTIDGSLSEAVWLEALSVSDFRQVEPNQGAFATFDTEVRILYDEVNLYVGAFCRDTLGSAGVRVPDLRRDFDFFQNDLFGISLDLFNDRRNCVAFQTNPYGAQRDLLSFDDRLYDRDWDGVWTVRTTITDSGWTAEMAIPWATLRYPATDKAMITDATTGAAAASATMMDVAMTAEGAERNFGVNFVRIVRRINELSAWSPFPRAYTPYRMSYAGTLTDILPPPPKANVRVQPYTVLQQQSQVAAERSTTLTPTAGGEVKWALTPSAVLDLTLNTDFAQADVDRQVVNLSRFSVFFPERRPFFLESASLFAVGAAGEVEPFFSRRIGLDDFGNLIPIDGGVRFVSRDLSRNIGGLVMRTRGTDTQPASTFGIGRYSQNLGEQNRIGTLVAVRRDDEATLSGAVTNSVGAIDGFVRFNQDIYWQAMASGSITRGGKENEPAGDGFAGYSQVAVETNALKARWTETVITPNYTANSGFVSRGNLIASRLSGYPILRPLWKPAFIRAFEPDLTLSLYHSAADGRLQEAEVSASPLYCVLQNGGYFYFKVENRWQFLTEAFAPLSGLSVVAGDYRYTSIDTYFSTDQSSAVSGIIQGRTGGYFNGWLNSADFTISLRPSPQVAFSIRYLWNELR